MFNVERKVETADFYRAQSVPAPPTHLLNDPSDELDGSLDSWSDEDIDTNNNNNINHNNYNNSYDNHYISGNTVDFNVKRTRAQSHNVKVPRNMQKTSSIPLPSNIPAPPQILRHQSSTSAQPGLVDSLSVQVGKKKHNKSRIRLVNILYWKRFCIYI